MRKSLAIMLGMAIVASVALAGQVYGVKCSDKACGMEGGIYIGGWMNYDLASGYCVECGKFITLKWPRHAKDDKDVAVLTPGSSSRPATQPTSRPAGKVFDGSTGEIRSLYTCPFCGRPFLELTKVPTTCPKCCKAKLETTSEVSKD